MKKVMFAFVAILAVALMAGSAFAAASLSAGNSTVAAEVLNSAAVTNFAPGVVNAYQTGGLVGAGATIRVRLTDAAFTAASTVNLCRGATPIATGTAIAPANNTADLLVSAPISAADILNFQNAACGVAPTTLTNVNFNAGLAAGATVTMSVDNAASAGDPIIAATGTIATVKQQFSATLAPVTSKLNFTTNMKSFIADAATAPPNTPATDRSQAAVTIFSDQSIAFRVPTVDGPGTCDSTIADADVTATITLTGDLTGIASLDFGATSVAVVAADVTAASKTLTLTGNQIPICKSGGANPDTPTPRALTMVAKTVLPETIIAGTRSAAITLKGNGLSFPNLTVRTLVATTPSHLIQLDAASAIIPFLSTNPTVKTNCVISNTSSTLTGTVTFTVTAKDGGGVLPGTFTLGTIGPKTTVNLIFDTNNATLGANPPVVLGLGANVRFSGNIAVSAPPSGLAFNCLQTDPVAGPKRLVPVLQANSTNMPIF